MAKTPKRSRIDLLTGPRVAFYFYLQEDNVDGGFSMGDHLPFVGRGSGFSDQGNFPRIPVAELGNDGIDEYGPGQASLTFTLQRFEGTRQDALQHLPFRSYKADSWTEKPRMVCTAVLHYGPNHGKLLWTFYGVELQTRGRGGAAGTAVTGNFTFIFTHEEPSDWVLNANNERPTPVEEVPSS